MQDRKKEIQANLDLTRQSIQAACFAAGREADAVNLIVVSKTHPMSDIRAAFEFGCKAFGENRVQELQQKMQAAEAEGLNIEWHLIGTLQSNKVRFVAGKVKLIHSVHKLKLIRDIARHCQKNELTQDILLQVNIAEEESKFGFPQEEVKQAVECALSFPEVNLRGLMCMAPFFEDSRRALPVFEECATLFHELQRQYPELPFDTLSMGMSADYPEAILAGSTHIRLGSSVFGVRQNG